MKPLTSGQAHEVCVHPGDALDTVSVLRVENLSRRVDPDQITNLIFGPRDVIEECGVESFLEKTEDGPGAFHCGALVCHLESRYKMILRVR